MSTDLLEAYFQRDLSDKELAQIEASLARSEEVAERFAGLAAAFSAELGLPDAKPGSGRGRIQMGWWLGAMGLALALAALFVGLHHRSLARSPLSARPQAHAAPLAPSQAPAARKAAAVPPPPAGPLPGQASHAYAGLEISLDVQDQGQVTARVLDQGGATRRLLYDGTLEPGQQTLRWDGLDDAGQPCASGEYIIEVTQGAATLRRTVVLDQLPPEPR